MRREGASLLLRFDGRRSSPYAPSVVPNSRCWGQDEGFFMRAALLIFAATLIGLDRAQAQSSAIDAARVCRVSDFGPTINMSVPRPFYEDIQRQIEARRCRRGDILIVDGNSASAILAARFCDFSFPIIHNAPLQGTLGVTSCVYAGLTRQDR